MEKLKSLFQQCFGIAMPKDILINEPLVPLSLSNESEQYLWGSKIATEKQYLIQGHIDSFIEEVPEGYYLIGFWGHGVNSYAFYYSMVGEWRRIFFRLPYGGIYIDNEMAGKQVRGFLEKYIDFEKSLAGSVKSLIAVDSMRSGYYKIIKNDGQIIELKESFFENPNFKERILGKAN